MKRLNKYWLLAVGCWLLAGAAQAQMIRSGKISYERRTNLHKKFPDEETRRWIGSEKYKYDNFVLYFNDTMSVFVFEDSPNPGRGDWATVKNNHVTFLNQNVRHSLLNIMGEEAVIIDTLKRRPFKRLGNHTCTIRIFFIFHRDTQRARATSCLDLSTISQRYEHFRDLRVSLRLLKSATVCL